MTPKKEMIERVASRTLEDAAYILASRESDPPDISSWPALGARLSFASPLEGYCELWAPSEITALLATNILGIAEGSPDALDLSFDAMTETLNILCGYLMTEIAQDDPTPSYGMPTRREGIEPFPEGSRGVNVWLASEGHPILVRACFGNHTHQAA
ncbi:hypothetical protein ACFL6M_00135 [Candidatus Eisenbacteria bacterium]|uniref:Chemotaxis phosphatase CheX-like domain-containing protein n=1 Tax=Eiseniibacteriota bacterium TaxID=2212470 RepID=A0ABV6YIG9_UNCEI